MIFVAGVLCEWFTIMEKSPMRQNTDTVILIVFEHKRFCVHKKKPTDTVYERARIMSCIDIIVCKRRDGSLKSSPFFIRFSNRNELPHSQTLLIKLNGQLASMREHKLVVKSGQQFAFFQKRYASSTLVLTPTSTSAQLIPTPSNNSPQQEAQEGMKDANPPDSRQRKEIELLDVNNKGVIDSSPSTTVIPQLTITSDDEDEESEQQKDNNNESSNLKQTLSRSSLSDDEFLYRKKQKSTTVPTNSSNRPMIENRSASSAQTKPIQPKAQTLMGEAPQIGSSSSRRSDTSTVHRSYLGNAMYNVYEKMKERWLQTIDSLKLPEQFTTPPDELLKKLDLNREVNHISIISKDETLHGRIFVWDEDCRIVISDIDGTITRSDVLGQVATRFFGMQYTHPGVAKLFDNIANKGYKFVYVTVRSIGQSNFTQDYLRRVKDGESVLPLGPVIMPPVAGSSIVRWRMPTEFKIPILYSIQDLWPRNPIVAAWGNRETDALAYIAVGIDPAKCWIVNSSGEVVAHDGGLDHKQKHRRFASYSYLADNWRHLQLTERDVKEKEHVVGDIGNTKDMEKLSRSFGPASTYLDEY